MPRPTFVNCAFQPELCPLLQGLSPDEQRLRMETDPLIRNCKRAVESGGSYPAQCTKPKAKAVLGSKSARGRIVAGA